MKTILVAGSKGGVGKTTIATQLAAYYALQDRPVVLADADPQRPASRWAERRADPAHAVLPLDATRRRAWRNAIPEATPRVIIDAPAGAAAAELEPYLEAADAVLVPVTPSALDIDATSDFLTALAKVPRIHQRRLPVGLVLNRGKPWTSVTRQVVAMLSGWPYPLLAQLRDSQAYVVLTGLGRSLFDYHSASVRGHQGDWQPLLKWLKKNT